MEKLLTLSNFKIDMKKIVLLILTILVCTGCSPRKNFSNSKVSEIKSIIEYKQFNIIYRGLENRMTIFVPGADSIKVSGIGISTTDSTKVFEMRIKKFDENIYGFTPGRGDKMLMSIFSFLNGKESFEKREFRIFNIQSPYTSINGQIIQIKMSKESLAQSKIEMLIPQLIFEMPKVKNFSFKINDGESYFVERNLFDLTAKEKILNLKIGDVVLIYDVQIDYINSGRMKNLKELKIYIE